jgi:hypothetical protein
MRSQGRPNNLFQEHALVSWLSRAVDSLLEFTIHLPHLFRCTPEWVKRADWSKLLDSWLSAVKQVQGAMSHAAVQKARNW